MVEGVKQSVKKTMGRTTLDYDALQTAVVEIEAIINARPLTYIYDDEESLSSPLTPSHRSMVDELLSHQTTSTLKS